MLRVIRTISVVAGLVSLVGVGCGGEPASPDAGAERDACATCVDSGSPPDDAGSDDSGDAGSVDGGSIDAGRIDGGPPPVPEDPVVVAAASTGHDRFFGVAFDAAGRILAVGQTAPGIDATDDHAILLARFEADGTLDASFGEGGFATRNVAVGGRARELGRSVVVQSSGRIVVVGTAEADPALAGLAATDTNVVLVGFTPEGDVDPSFGEGGVAVHDLSPGSITVNAMGVEVLSNHDDVWGSALVGDDGIVIHARQRTEGVGADGTTRRSDTDWAILRVTADGDADASFGGGDGRVTLDIASANASARGIAVLADGSILASGYTTSNALFPSDPAMTSQQPVLWKVLASGDPDATFATDDATTIPGVWHDFLVAPPARAEAYGAAVQGDHLVTIGYGPPVASGTSDLVSGRFTLDGALDTTYGASGGHTYVDVASSLDASAAHQADNGHGVVVLPDGRVLGAGQGRVMHAALEQDAVILVLTEDGLPDVTFGTNGVRAFDPAGDDQLWAVALSPDASRIVAVGLAGAPSTGDDDDALLVILAVE